MHAQSFHRRKIISKTDTLRKLIQQDGRGNSALLVALRLVPGVPVHSISGIYGSFDFGYLKFLIFSIVGFMPRLISYTFVGRNIFDPLSGGFLGCFRCAVSEKCVYKDGFDASGRKVSIHYFESQSGRVFNVKVKPYWSNL